MYRDELTRASQRIEEMEEKLDAQRSELAGLREQIAKRLAAPPRASRWGYALAAAGGAAMATIPCWLAYGRAPMPTPVASANVPSATSSPATPSPATSAPPARVAPSASTSASPPIPTHGRSDVRIQVASDERVATLGRRCARAIPRGSLDALPRGTRVMDFKTCAGCDCCQPGGVFPPTWDEHSRVIPSTGECLKCSRAFTLANAGLTIAGGADDDPLRGTSGLIFSLAKPARVFALDIGGSGYSTGPHPTPDARMSLVAYDPSGMAIDAVAATYPSTGPATPDPAYFEKLRRVLLVEACPGESIARVDVGTSDLNTTIRAIALLPAD